MYFLNHGVSFGAIKTQWWLLGGIVLLLAVYRLVNFSSGVWLIFFGGVSNWLDRLVYGGVVDMFNGYWFWFNIADAMITLGAVVVIYESIYERKI